MRIPVRHIVLMLSDIKWLANYCPSTGMQQRGRYFHEIVWRIIASSEWNLTDNICDHSCVLN